MRVFLLVLLLAGAAVAAEPDFPTFDSSAVAGKTSWVYKGFEKMLQQGEASREQFWQMVREGKPAARLYGAVGLWHLNPIDGKAALEELVDDEDNVICRSGAFSYRKSVGWAARQLLDDKPDGILKLSLFLPEPPREGSEPQH